MISFQRLFQHVVLRTTVLLLLLVSIVYVGWRFRLSWRESNIQVQDTTLQPELSPTPFLEPSPTATEQRGVLFRLKNLKKVSLLQPEQVGAAQRSYLGEQPIATQSTQVMKYRLSYEVQSENGEYLPAFASIYVPMTKQKDLPWYVFGAGTSGLADACAPSKEKVEVSNIGNYENQMIVHAAQNQVVIFPDYLGFGDDQRIQPYFIAEMEARSLLGALVTFAEVAKEEDQLKNLSTDNIFFAGYSQGGHAALSAASRRAVLPEELKIQGVIGYAAASNIEALFSESPRLGPYIIRSYEQYYGQISPDQFLQPQWLRNYVFKTENTCIDHIGKAFPNTAGELYSVEFAAALKNKTLELSYPKLHELLQKNMSITNVEQLPILLLQGATDPIVTAKTQQGVRHRLCSLNAEVQYIEYPGINHYRTRQAGFFDTAQWMSLTAEQRINRENCQ